MAFDDDNYVWGSRPVPPRRPAAPPWLVPLLSVVLIVVLVGLGWTALYYYRAAREAENAVLGSPRAVEPRGELMDIEKSFIKIYKNAKPSVVHVSTRSVREDMFGMRMEEMRGTGTGFVWDRDGHIVTNFHVIKDAQVATVTLADQTTWRADVWAKAPDKDLAVLHIRAGSKKLHPIAVGQSSDLQVGQMVFAIGNPFGLDQTLTTGVVSALGREIDTENKRTLKNVIQTDAAINPGNSGGPLLDSAGRLIGVNTAIYSPSGSSAGIGFAIPVDEVNRVVPQLIVNRKVTRPDAGVQLATDQLANQLLQAGLLQRPGAVVIRVLRGSPAAKAGLVPWRRDEEGAVLAGDVIVAVDGTEVKGPNDFYAEMEKHKVGDTVTLTLLRDGKEVDVKVKLQEARQ